MTIVWAHDLTSRGTDLVAARVVASVARHFAKLGVVGIGAAKLDAGMLDAGMNGRESMTDALLPEEVGSLEAGWVALDKMRSAHSTKRGALAAASAEPAFVLACLDLPPAPRAGATLAEWALSGRLPVLVVAHGRRWIPNDRPLLANVPVISPAAAPADVDAAVAAAFAVARSKSLPTEVDMSSFDAFAARPSWLG